MNPYQAPQCMEGLRKSKPFDWTRPVFLLLSILLTVCLFLVACLVKENHRWAISLVVLLMPALFVCIGYVVHGDKLVVFRRGD